MFGKYTVVIGAIALLVVVVTSALGANIYLLGQLSAVAESERMTSTSRLDANGALKVVRTFGDGGDGAKERSAIMTAMDTLRSSPLLPESLAGDWRTLSANVSAALEGGDVSAARSAIAEQGRALVVTYERALTDAATSGDAFAAKARTFKLLQGATIGFAAVVFLMIVFYLTRTLRSEEEGVAQARRETEQILATVGEGLFLLDRDGLIGSEHSEAMLDIFRRDDFEDLQFDMLLRSLVTEKTLEVATDFVDLLWGDRVNENLVKDLNPLNEVEVSFTTGDGSFETRYLAFEFNRVKVDGEISHLLVTVTDITERILLARELEESQAQSQAQLDLLLSILHVEPSMLGEFLDETDASMARVNKILSRPARDEVSFREKLNEIFREIHKVKGESAALGLATIELKSHEFEDSLEELRGRDVLGGNDFLPLAVMLDDLLSHLASVRDLINRIANINLAKKTYDDDSTVVVAARPADSEDTRAMTAKLDVVVATPESLLSGSPEPSAPAKLSTKALSNMVKSLGQEVADDVGKQVKIETSGLDRLPGKFQSVVKDIALQLLRNAVTHGIEAPDERAELGKSADGKVRVRFGTRDDGQFELRCEDDGRGLCAETIKQSALAKGLISPEDAATLDEARAVFLIFKPGFSTAESVGRHAGRGVGMDVVRSRAKEVGGRVRLQTKPGKGSVIRVVFPANEDSVAA